MGAAECGEFADDPRCFIVVVKQKITCEQAQELGRVLGRAGFQGDFLSGTAADLLWKEKNGRREKRGAV